MPLPTLDEIKAAYAAHPEIKPLDEEWVDISSARKIVGCCPLSILMIDKGHVADVLRIYGFSTLDEQDEAASQCLGMRKSEVTGFRTGFDDAFLDESVADREAFRLGRTARLDILMYEDED